MLFRIDDTAGSLHATSSSWRPKELELEGYLIQPPEPGETLCVLNEAVLAEPLLVISNQVRTRAKKRADILALDKAGNAVIVELKRDAGRIGVETQALQYLADVSAFKGRDFIRRYASERGLTEDQLSSWLEGADLDRLNERQRVILVARDFDPSIYSVGEWLSSMGVAFRCVSYHPIEIGGTRFLSFAVRFDRSPYALFPLSFGTIARSSGIFWHNIARAGDDWWQFLVKRGQIAACFDNAPGDPGERIMQRYVAGDIIVAYAKGHGAVGWGVVQGTSPYRLLPSGHPDDVCGECLHRLAVDWKAVAPRLADGLSAEAIRQDYGIYHPVSTSVSIKKEPGQRLIAALTQRFAGR